MPQFVGCVLQVEIRNYFQLYHHHQCLRCVLQIMVTDYRMASLIIVRKKEIPTQTYLKAQVGPTQSDMEP